MYSYGKDKFTLTKKSLNIKINTKDVLISNESNNDIPSNLKNLINYTIKSSNFEFVRWYRFSFRITKNKTINSLVYLGNNKT